MLARVLVMALCLSLTVSFRPTSRRSNERDERIGLVFGTEASFDQRRSEGAAGHTGRHLLGAANGRKLFLKIHVKIQIVISYVFACNTNKAIICTFNVHSLQTSYKVLSCKGREVAYIAYTRTLYCAEYLHLKTNPLYQHTVVLTAN